MSDGRQELVSGIVSSKRGLWNRNTNNINNMISATINKTFVKSDTCLNGQAEQDLSLNELMDELELLARPETRPAVQYLRQLLGKLEGCQTIKCTLNRMLLKARVELQVEKKHTEHVQFRATNALHLNGSELQTANVLCFEATIVDDGIMLSGVTGLSVKVSVLKGTFRCDVLQARIQSSDGQCLLHLKTRNPLIGQTEDFELVDLEADVCRDYNYFEDEDTKAARLLERKEKAHHLRTTYTGMKSLSLSDIVKHSVTSSANKQSSSTPASNLRLVYLKKILMIYAFSLVLAASYLYLMTQVPSLVPIAMILSALSFFLLGFERKWTVKAILALLFNASSMMVVIIKLYLIS